MSFSGPSREDYKVTAYLGEGVTAAEGSLLKTNNGVVDYWLTKLSSFPCLSKVALRVLATPASSASSERDFSILKFSVSKQRRNLKDDIIDAKSVLHCYLQDKFDRKKY